MATVEQYWKNLLKDAKAKGLNKTLDDVEKAWRTTRNELNKEGIKPDDPKYNAQLMLRTKKKVMNESSLLESKAYSEGLNACYRGKTLEDNPYLKKNKADSEFLSKEWIEGFNFAASKKKKVVKESKYEKFLIEAGYVPSENEIDAYAEKHNLSWGQAEKALYKKYKEDNKEVKPKSCWGCGKDWYGTRDGKREGNDYLSKHKGKLMCPPCIEEYEQTKK